MDASRSASKIYESESYMKRLLLALIYFIAPVNAQQLIPTNNTVQGNLTAQGSTCLTTNACVAIHLASNANAVALVLTGTWSATVNPEYSADNGATWQSAGTNQTSNGTTTY